MKNLKTYISEKLIINKNLKACCDLNCLYDINFKRGRGSNVLITYTNIIELIAEYIRNTEIKSFNNIAAFIKANNTKNGYFAGINENTLEIVVYHKITDSRYEKFSIFGDDSLSIINYKFNYYPSVDKDSIFPLRYNSSMNKHKGAEWYEISMETYNEIINVHRKISLSINEKS